MSPTSLSFLVPLAFDTVYFVDSPDNEPLNQAMRQIEQSHSLLFDNAEVQPFPFKLLCLTREELAADRLRARFAGLFAPELVDDTIDALRECLQADTGGTLTARCLPRYSGDVRVEDRAVCIAEDFGKTSPKEALETAQLFVRDVANENFYRMAGTSYYNFIMAKKEYGRPQRYSGWGEIAFITVPPDPKKIIQKLQKHLADLNDSITAQTNADDIYSALESEMQRQKDECKVATPFKLKVEDEKIYVILSENVRHEVVFGRRGVAKALYVFFLRQIERAKMDHTDPIYISKQELESYKEELLEIYQRIGHKYSAKVKNIESWWDPSYNDFDNALSSIRKFFNTEFDTDTIKDKYGKCYSVQIMGKDRYGNPRYGINLDIDDFDLGRYSYRRF